MYCARLSASSVYAHPVGLTGRGDQRTALVPCLPWEEQFVITHPELPAQTTNLEGDPAAIPSHAKSVLRA